MTSYKKHLIRCTLFLTAFFLVLGYLGYLGDLTLLDLGLGISVGYVYSLLPDIDHPVSYIRKKFNLYMATLTIVFLIVYLTAVKNDILLYLIVVLAVLQLAVLKLKHRGFTHQIAFGVLASLPFILISPIISAMAFLGFISHLSAD